MNRLASRIALLMLVAACGAPVSAPDGGSEEPLDAGGATRDAGAGADGGLIDAGVLDAGLTPTDAGTTLDAGIIDAGPSLDDAGIIDAGPSLDDAGIIDAGPSLDDAGIIDAGPSLDDAGTIDAGLVLDAGIDGGLVLDAGIDAGLALDAGLSFDGGTVCHQTTDCASGFCVDGVCCDSACVGLCESCALPGRAGTCDAIPTGADPDDDCAAQPASTCGTTGACSGQRACERWPMGSVCQAAFCSGANSQLADTCDGQGTCVDRGAQLCAPLTCDTTSGICRTSCSVPSHCASGFTCTGGICKRAPGQSCLLGTECASGFCTDGVCCESACSGTCERCSQSGRLGFCDPVPAGLDTDAECAAQAQSTCGTTGVCSGNRSCARFAAAVECVAPACLPSGGSTNGSRCDGLGACVAVGLTSCGVYTCNGLTGLCRTSCSVGADCASGFTCGGGVCRKVAGASCQAGAECASGFCVDGVCCGSACAGPCESCNQPGRLGLCDAVPAGQDPSLECATNAASTCGTTGVCSGSRSCQLYPSSTVCAAAFCPAQAVARPAATCSGFGACVTPANVSCGNYACNTATGSCRVNCSAPSDCATGRTCSSGQCL